MILYRVWDVARDVARRAGRRVGRRAGRRAGHRAGLRMWRLEGHPVFIKTRLRSADVIPV